MLHLALLHLCTCGPSFISETYDTNCTFQHKTVDYRFKSRLWTKKASPNRQTGTSVGSECVYVIFADLDPSAARSSSTSCFHGNKYTAEERGTVSLSLHSGPTVGPWRSCVFTNAVHVSLYTDCDITENCTVIAQCDLWKIGLVALNDQEDKRSQWVVIFTLTLRS